MIKVVAANLSGNKEVTLLSGDEVGGSVILFYEELLSGDARCPFAGFFHR